MNKSRPVLIVFSILAGLQVLSGGASLGDVIGKDTAGLFILLIAAVQVGMTFYVQGLTVPVGDVAAYVTGGDNPKLVAGPASSTTNGAAVTVAPEAPTQVEIVGPDDEDVQPVVEPPEGDI